MRPIHLALAALTLVLGCTPSSPPPAPAASATSTGPSSSSTSSAPASSAAPASARASDTIATKAGDLKITPIYHASVLLEIAGKTIYVDPFSKGDLGGLPKADFILITDIHGDHLDPKALDLLATPATKIVAPPAVAAQIKDRPNVTVLENGKKHSFDLFEVEAVPMYNLERGPEPNKRYHDKGRGNGYVVTFGDKRVYFSGDTECTPEMKALTAIDVAFVCMNLPYTMPPKEAAVCINAFKPKVLYPYHYGVPGGGPPSNLDELKSALDPKAGVEVRLRKWY